MNRSLAEQFQKSNSSQEEIMLSFTFMFSDEIMWIYTLLTYGIICELVVLFGIISNIINIICFVKQGFQESINVSFLSLSISDLGCLITLSVSNVFCVLAFNTSDLTFDPTEVNYLTGAIPHLTFSRATGWITAFITLERCLCVSAPLKIKGIMTTRRATVINVCIFVVVWCSSAPVYVVNKLEFKFSHQLNKTVLGIISTEQREHVEKITFTINNFILPFVTFIIISVCALTLVVTLNSTAKWREQSVGSGLSHGVTNRNMKIAKMVVAISTLFIICFVPTSVSMLAVAFHPELSFGGKYVNVAFILGGLCFLMVSTNSSANMFIYYHVSTKYRDIFLKLCCRTRKKV